MIALLALIGGASAQCAQFSCVADADCAGCGEQPPQQHPIFNGRSDVNFTCNTNTARCELGTFAVPQDLQPLCIAPQLNEVGVKNLCCHTDYYFDFDDDDGTPFFVTRQTPDQVCGSKGCNLFFECNEIGTCELSGPLARKFDCCNTAADCPATDPAMQTPPIPGSREDVCTQVTCNPSRDCIYFLDPTCCVNDGDCGTEGTGPCDVRTCINNRCEIRHLQTCMPNPCSSDLDCGFPFEDCADLRCRNGQCVAEIKEPLPGGCCRSDETAEEDCSAPGECRRIRGCDSDFGSSLSGVTVPTYQCEFAPPSETGCCINDEDCDNNQSPCLVGSCDADANECRLANSYTDDDNQAQPCCITQEDCEERCQILGTCTAQGVPVETCEWYRCNGGFRFGTNEDPAEAFRCETRDIDVNCVDGTSRSPAVIRTITSADRSDCQWTCPGGGQPNQFNMEWQFGSAENVFSSGQDERPVYFWQIVAEIYTNDPSVQNVSEVLLSVQQITPVEQVEMQALGAPRSNETDGRFFQAFEPEETHFLYPDVPFESALHQGAMNVSFIPDPRVDLYEVDIYLVQLDPCQPSFPFAPQCQGANSNGTIMHPRQLIASYNFPLGTVCSEPCQVGPPTPPTPPPQPTPPPTPPAPTTVGQPTPFPPGPCPLFCPSDRSRACTENVPTGFRAATGFCVRYRDDGVAAPCTAGQDLAEPEFSPCMCDGDQTERCTCQVDAISAAQADCSATGRCGFCSVNPEQPCRLRINGPGIVLRDAVEPGARCYLFDEQLENEVALCSFETFGDEVPEESPCVCSGFLTYTDACYCEIFDEGFSFLLRCQDDPGFDNDCGDTILPTVAITYEKETCAFGCSSNPQIRGNGYTVTYEFSAPVTNTRLPERIGFLEFSDYGTGTPYFLNGTQPIPFTYGNDLAQWSCEGCDEFAPSFFVGSRDLPFGQTIQFQVFFETQRDLSDDGATFDPLLGEFYSNITCLQTYANRGYCRVSETGECAFVDRVENPDLSTYNCEVEECEPSSTPPNAIQGIIFYDRDNDTIRDSGEGGVPGIVVDLVYRSNNTVRQSTATNTAGEYTFLLSPMTGRASALVFPRIRNSSVPSSLVVQRLTTRDAYDNNFVIVGGNNFDPASNRGVTLQINDTFFASHDGALVDVPPCQRDFGPFDDDDVVVNAVMIGCAAENERYESVKSVCNDRVCRANGGLWRTYLVRHSLSNFAAFSRPASSIQVTVTPGDPEDIRCLDLEEVERESVNVQVLRHEPMVAGRGGIGAQTHASVAYRYPSLPADTEDFAVATTAVVLCTRNASDTLNITATVYGDYCRELITRWTQCEQGLDIRECYTEDVLDLSLPSDCPPPSPTPPPTPAPPPAGGLEGSRFVLGALDFCTEALCIDGGLLEIAGCSAEESSACAAAGAQRSFQEIVAVLRADRNASASTPAGPVQFSVRVQRSHNVEPACGTTDQVGALVEVIILKTDTSANLTDARLLNFGSYELEDGEFGAFVVASALYEDEGIQLRLSIPECVPGGLAGAQIGYNVTTTLRAPDCVDDNRCSSEQAFVLADFDSCNSDACPRRENVRPADGFDQVDDELAEERRANLPLLLAAMISLCAICIVGTLCFSGVLGTQGRPRRARRYRRRDGAIRVHEPCPVPRRR